MNNKDLLKYKDSLDILNISPEDLGGFLNPGAVPTEGGKKARTGIRAIDRAQEHEQLYREFEKVLFQAESLNGNKIHDFVSRVIEKRVELERVLGAE